MMLLIENYHYVEDVASHFASCALEPFEGYGAFNIRGKTLPVDEFLSLVREGAAASGMSGAVDIGIAPDATQAFFVCDLDSAAIQAAFPSVPRTPLETGIRLSLETFREMAADGRLQSV